MRAFRHVWLVLIAVQIASADGPLTVRSRVTDAQPRLRTGTDLVLVNASAYDRDGRLVADVRQEQLRVFDEGVERQIASFVFEDVPVSVAIVLDASGSMRSTLPHIKSALTRLADVAKTDDEFSLITVKDAPAVSVPFSKSVEHVQLAIRAQHAGGPTALYDALVLAFEHVKTGKNARKVILLFTDGQDTNSRFNWNELRRHAMESTAAVYAFVMGGRDEDEILDGIRLQGLVEATGGRCLTVHKPQDFVSRMETLDVHRQYLIGFRAMKGVTDGKYRKIQLKLDDDVRKLRLYWRRGYYAPQH